MQLKRNFNFVNAAKSKKDDKTDNKQDNKLQIKQKNEPSAEAVNMIKYTEQMMETFEQKPFSEVDALIFSWLSYMDFPDICIQNEPVRLGDLYRAEIFPQLFSSVVALEETKQLFTVVCASPRYRDIGVSHYVSRLDTESLKQFSAVNFHVSDDLRFIAFRGTDKYIVGWKEDLCLALADPVESQKSSVRYLKRCAGDFDGKIITGGHSKGGNLAVYSAALSEESVQDRISLIYSFDGPGIDSAEAEPYIAKIRDRIVKIIPQSSLIGLLMETCTDYRIVKSDRYGVSQHMAYYWHIVNGEFEYTDELSYDSRILSASINKWILNLDYDERSQIVQSLFDLINTTSIDALDNIDFMKAIPEIKKNFDEMSPEARKNLIANMKNILAVSVKSIPAVFEKQSN